MQMNPKYFFENYVIPNYDEFCNDEGNIRKAFNAVISLASMPDNYFNYYERRGSPCIRPYLTSVKRNDKERQKENLITFKSYLGSLSSYFIDIQSMSNAYKHLYTNAGSAYVSVESGGAVFVQDEENGDDDIDTDELKPAYCSKVYYTANIANNSQTYTVKEALESMITVWKTLVE